MFESIYITPQQHGSLDLGFLAETMIFYNKVNIIASHYMLKSLIDTLGPELLTECVELGFLKIFYNDTGLAVLSDPHNNKVPMGFGIVRSPQQDKELIVPNMFINKLGRRGKGRRLAKRFLSYLSILRYNEPVTSDSTEYFSNSKFVYQSAISVINDLAPDYKIPDNFKFDVMTDKRGVIIETNMDFIEANKIYQVHNPNSKLDVPLILNHILIAKGIMHLATDLKTEIATMPLYESIIKNKFAAILKNRENNVNEISLFQDYIFDNAKQIREIINSGERNFKDLLNVLYKAKKFHEWLTDKEDDAGLIKSYFQEVTKDSWVDKLPSKTFRWAFFTGTGMFIDSLGAGGFGTALGIGISALDSLLLDKIIKGWKPNQFIDNSLKPFAIN